MIIPFKTSVPVDEVPLVTTAIVIICTCLTLFSSGKPEVSVYFDYCKTVSGQTVTEIMSEYLNKENVRNEHLVCASSLYLLSMMDIDSWQEQEEVNLPRHQIKYLKRQQKKMRKKLGISSYRTFDPENFSLISIVTANFYHAGWMHLLGNMLFLFVFGAALESLIGSLRFGLIFLFSGVGAHLVYAILSWIGILSGNPTLGASAAIYGILGGIYKLYPRLKVTIFYFFMVAGARTSTMPAKYLIALFVLMDIIRLPMMKYYEVNFVGHLAGFSCVYWYFRNENKDSTLNF